MVGAGRNYFDLIPMSQIQWVDKWLDINLISFAHSHLLLEMLKKIVGIGSIRRGYY
jgi:hypothetical protein